MKLKYPWENLVNIHRMAYTQMGGGHISGILWYETVVCHKHRDNNYNYGTATLSNHV